MIEQKQALPSENNHWYYKDGRACYEVPRAKGDGMRPTTLADARKLNLVPSVTSILKCAARPGLEAWKATQLLQSALTLPKKPSETVDDYAKRVIEDSKEQGKKAAERGTELHAAIEIFASQNAIPDMQWAPHLAKLQQTLAQYGIGLSQGKPEHSFASPLGYGGKLDWHDNTTVIDFKTKGNLNAKQLAWPEHCWQLAAYIEGVYGEYTWKKRAINVFIGITDCEVKIHEWSDEDRLNGWAAFQALLYFWQVTKNYGGK